MWISSSRGPYGLIIKKFKNMLSDARISLTKNGKNQSDYLNVGCTLNLWFSVVLLHVVMSFQILRVIFYDMIILFTKHYVSESLCTSRLVPCEKHCRLCNVILLLHSSENRKTKKKAPKMSKVQRRNYDKRAKVQRRSSKMEILKWKKQPIPKPNHSCLGISSKNSRNRS